MKVRDIMVKDVISISPKVSIKDAVAQLRKIKISGLPVVDTNNKLVGMFTEKGMLRYILPGYIKKVGAFVYHNNARVIKNRVQELLNERAVEDIMQKEVVTVDADASIAELARLMLTHSIRRVPVVMHDGTMVGIVAREDVIKTVIAGEDITAQ